MKEAKRNSSAAAGRGILSDLLRSQLPHKTVEELSVHEDWFVSNQTSDFSVIVE
jgi:hypothetical protein